MKLWLEINENMSADMCGEALLYTVNDEDRWGYWTEELKGHWVEIEACASDRIIELLQGCFWEEEGDRRITHIYNPALKVSGYLYWDGDGVLIFELPDGSLLYNGDMKKSYGWVWKNNS